jgi:5-methylcytosine-specific restriction endonuclease McrA
MISKRLRYEILRRDGHHCRYCGLGSDEVTITVDHVIPTALGGTDDPSNLVAACRDCNSGKASP